MTLKIPLPSLPAAPTETMLLFRIFYSLSLDQQSSCSFSKSPLEDAIVNSLLDSDFHTGRGRVVGHFVPSGQRKSGMVADLMEQHAVYA